MRCSKCGGDNRQGRKFCAQCGAAMAARCARCGAPNEPGEKFCGDCGAPLTTPSSQALSTVTAGAAIRVAAEEADASPPVDGERKIVTALFADIKGSTELMEELDPEEARAIIDPGLQLRIDAVRRYDGYVVQSTGDGIFALFGAPVAHEDHPQRGLYAALQMQRELHKHGERRAADGGAALEARI